MLASIFRHKVNSYYAVLAYIAVVLLFYHQTLFSMIAIWMRANTYTHCFLIAPISLWLIWQRRKTISTLSPSINYFGLSLTFFCGILWLIGKRVDVQVIEQMALVSMIISGVWANLGTNILKTILFPLLYLYFSVPIGDSLIPWLMEYTANFTVWSIKLTGIPVYQEGLTLQLPSGTWEVIEACSGIRYLIASICLGMLFAYLNYQKFYKRLIFLLFSIIVPILANGIRAFLIVMLGHSSNLKFAAGEDHLVIGWVFYGIVIFILFAVGIIWRDPIEPKTVSAQTKVSELHQNAFYIFILTLTISISWPLYAKLGEKGPQQIAENPKTINFDLTTKQGFTAIKPSRNQWQPIEAGADSLADFYFELEGKTVGLHLRHFSSQREGLEVTNHKNFIKDAEKKWRPTLRSKNKNQFELDGRLFSVNQQLIQSSSRKLLVWSWYKIGKIHTSNDYKVKAFEGWQSLVNQEISASRIIFVTEIFEEEAFSQAQALEAASLILETAIIQTFGLIDTVLDNESAR